MRSIAYTTLVINGPPMGGTFSVAPNTGQALITVFTLTSAGWADVDLPITVGFGYYDPRCCSRSTYQSPPILLTGMGRK